MIALPSQLPLLRIGGTDGIEIADYGRAWIASSIKAAAQRAGHQEWWIADDIARGVYQYLQRKFPGTSITLEELSGKIRGILNRIGFTDIAEAVSVEPPLCPIHLADLAIEAQGSELHFFALLEARIRALAAHGVRRLTLSGTRAAVKFLLSSKKWTSSCACLQEKILHFANRRFREGNELEIELLSDAA